MLETNVQLLASWRNDRVQRGTLTSSDTKESEKHDADPSSWHIIEWQEFTVGGILAGRLVRCGLTRVIFERL